MASTVANRVRETLADFEKGPLLETYVLHDGARGRSMISRAFGVNLGRNALRSHPAASKG